MTTLPLSEVFGPTWQGEGPHAGRRVAFLRLGLCNLACEWCDTPYTWDTTRYDVHAECPDTPIEEIHAQLHHIGCSTVVLTGGEPMMHRHKLRDLLQPREDVGGGGWWWHVETNATITPPVWWPDHVAHTTLSPKIATNDPVKKRLKPRALQAWADYGWDTRAVAWKFVITRADQLDAIADLARTYRIPNEDIWVMPEGTTTGTLLGRHRTLAPAILAAGYNTTTRLHTLLWGPQRGH